ncbi:PAS domain S-box protein [Oscillatoriales cyanobacterium LEGE 11467]|uniref:histidine kinase n=1 Tax=Zarconia navalis LEGE 11467 TaxID=1828826 RepID=A0A928Z7I2_9CYAN|nr:PAS domain S-box protein [Zarconia navalis]MBE9041467.1 PAS domain S-box protein [Zarconia navalis LEGE 11467]
MPDRSDTPSLSTHDLAKYLRLALEQMPAAIAILDRQMCYVAVSRRWRSDYGLGDRHLAGRSHYEIFPEIGTRWKAIHQNCLAGAIEKCEEEAFAREDGSIDWLHWEVRPWYIEAGEIGGLVMRTEVVTQRKQAELALQAANSQLEAKVKERTVELERTVAQLQQEIDKRRAAEATLARSEAKYRHLVENVEDTIWSCQPDGTLTYLSPAFEKMFGLDRSEYVGYSFASLVHPEDLQTTVLSFNQAIETGASVQSQEFRHQCRDGCWRWVVFNISVSHDRDGNIAVVQGTLKDISDRIAVEAKLRQQQQLLQAVVENTNACIFVKDYLNLDGQYILVNQRTADIFGIPREASCGKTDYELFPQEMAEQLDKIDREILETGKPFQMEEDIPQADGTHVFQTHKFTIEDEAGRPYALCGVATDITDFKVMEAALRESEAQFRSLFEQAAVGVAKIGLDGRWLMVNQKLCDSLGYTADQLQGSRLYWESIAPEDRAVTEEQWQALHSGQISSYSQEKRYLRRDGTPIWMQTTTKLVRDARQEAQYLIKVIEDIGDRKRQEEALRLIVEGTASKTGEAFFRACVRYLSAVLQVRYVLIAQLIPGNEIRAQTLAFWKGDNFGDRFEYDLAQTLCDDVYKCQKLHLYSKNVQCIFPDDPDLVALDAQSYAGIPVVDRRGNTLGLIAVLDTQPMEWDTDLESSILRIFAARAGAEIERMRSEAALLESQHQLQQQAQREKILNQLTQQILHSLDFSTIVDRAVREIQRFLMVDRCHFAWHTVEPDGEYWDVMDEVRSPGLPSFVGRHRVAAFGPLCALLLHRKTLRIDDVREVENREVREFLQQLGNQSMLVLPVLDNSGRLGIITCIHVRKVRPWTEDEVELLEAIVTQLAIALDRAELFTQSQTKASELAIALQTLQRTQAQLVQHEKMSSLGQLVAGVAHEINNPVSFIHGNLVHAKDYLQDLLGLVDLYERDYPEPTPEIAQEIEAIELAFLKRDFVKLFQSMSVGTDRIRDIVKSLRTFSRLDESEVKEVDLHEGIESTLTILQTRLRSQSGRQEVQVVKDYGHLPKIECCAGQLNQVFMNILVNAIDALEERDRQRTPAQMKENPSTIHIQTDAIGEGDSDGRILIRIRDNGSGIDDEVRSKLFDPFFTTKPIGKGTGLGLSISYQIVVDRHQGQLSCNSIPREGTEFTIEIPFLNSEFGIQK